MHSRVSINTFSYTYLLCATCSISIYIRVYIQVYLCIYINAHIYNVQHAVCDIYTFMHMHTRIFMSISIYISILSTYIFTTYHTCLLYISIYKFTTYIHIHIYHVFICISTYIFTICIMQCVGGVRTPCRVRAEFFSRQCHHGGGHVLDGWQYHCCIACLGHHSRVQLSFVSVYRVLLWATYLNRLYICIYICVYIHQHRYIYVRIYIYMYTYMYIYAYIHIYKYKYIYIYK